MRAPWPDETLYDIAYRSVLRGLPGFESGRSFTRGYLSAVRWIDRDMESLLANDRSDYIYIHLLAPHPPLFLDSRCQSRPHPALSGFYLSRPTMTPADLDVRRLAYQEQVRCVNRTLLRVAQMAVEHGAVMALFSDHGSDLGGQLYKNGSDWSASERSERYGVFYAGFARDCDMGDLEAIINVGRRVVACIEGSPLIDLGNRTFLLSREWELTEFSGQTPASG